MTVNLQKLTIRQAVLSILFISALALLPFLGIADFNTKGEPREAIVSLTMLADNNWILPVNNGGEIPYKPPFFHWCVAAASLLNGGVVNEYTSRLPSAVALIAMSVAVCLFFSRRRSPQIGLLTAAVTLTAFEIYRAGMNCRVDMMLTALSVGAILMLFRWWEKGMRGFPLAAILLMSAATLTKGPVGIIVPCLCAGIFMLFRGVPFFKAFIWLALWGVLALILPFCWYAAAYSQGSEEFLRLVLEENFGRMTGTMTYESHLNPWYYNIATLAAGFLPWTIAPVAALFLVKRAGWSHLGEALRSPFSRFGKWMRSADAATVLSLVSAAVIFIFYCIPASKRSVYLMPVYPFTAYFIALLLNWMTERRRGSVAGFCNFIAIAAIVIFAVYVAVKTGAIPDSIFGHGKHAAQNVAMLDSLRSGGGARAWVWAAISFAAACTWFGLCRKTPARNLPMMAAMLTVMLYLSLSGAYQPGVLQAKSVKGYAAEIERRFPDARGNIYEFISMAEEAAGNPIHYFEINFYMDDAVRNFRRECPAAGYLLMGDDDPEKFIPEFEREGYTFTRVLTPDPGLPRHTPSLFRFTRL